MDTSAAIRPDPARPRTWPLALRVPIQAAILTFVVATLSTQVALHFAREREDRLLVEALTPVMAAAAAVVRAELERAGSADPDPVETALAGLVGGAGGLLVGLEARWLTPDGAAGSAVAGTTGADGARGDTLSGPPAETDGTTLATTQRLPGGRVALAATLHWPAAEAAEGRIAVRLVADPGSLAAARSADQLRVALVDVLIAVLGALAALWFARGALRPIETLTARLVADGPTAEPPRRDEMEPLSTEFGRLQRVMEERVGAERERAAALYELAEKERGTVLAKLAAGLAHEVRNPLAGLLNTVSTLRRFGADPTVREESLDLLERGLVSIERVAAAALATYRPDRGGARLGPRDLADLGILAEPEARRRGVSLALDVRLTEPVAIDADAMRQVLLNLLLNAVKASGDGGRVELSARMEEADLVVAVSDTGPGLPGDVRRFLSAGRAEPVPRPDALGLWTIVRLIDDLEGRLSVDTHPGRGTTVTVRLTPRAADAALPGPGADGAASDRAHGERATPAADRTAPPDAPDGAR